MKFFDVPVNHVFQNCMNTLYVKVKRFPNGDCCILLDIDGSFIRSYDNFGDFECKDLGPYVDWLLKLHNKNEPKVYSWEELESTAPFGLYKKLNVKYEQFIVMEHLGQRLIFWKFDRRFELADSSHKKFKFVPDKEILT